MSKFCLSKKLHSPHVRYKAKCVIYPDDKYWHDTIARGVEPEQIGGLKIEVGLGGCGFSLAYGISSLCVTTDFETTASFLSQMYKAAYTSGNVLYQIATHQIEDSTHKALQRIGAHKIYEAPNLFHGPNMLETWMVNVRNGVGLYFDKYGDPFEKEPDPMPPAPPPITKPLGQFSMMYLPVKPEAKEVKQ